MGSSNASELYREMQAAIVTHHHEREATDASSPQRKRTLEARPSQTFELRTPSYNIADCRLPDVRWAVANILHFFAATEQAKPLGLYNSFAHRFINSDGTWKGAYGAAAMPGILSCILKLQVDLETRRAVVAMPDLLSGDDVNRPSCWTTLQFLTARDGLNLLVFQRSLNLTGVFPYDVTVLTNILAFVAAQLNVRPGSLYWTIGSLHAPPESIIPHVDGRRHESLILPIGLLKDSVACYEALKDPETCAFANVRDALQGKLQWEG